MSRMIGFALLAVSLSCSVTEAAEKYSLKTAAMPAPKELNESIAKLLNDNAIQLLDEKGEPIAELWARKEIPAKASPEQVKNGLTYRELPETSFLAAVRFNQGVTDYRKQRIKPGVYTLRLGFQPMDGDHMGTAPYNEFCLLVPADKDEKADPLGGAKELQDKSIRATGTSHPGVFMLFPNVKPEDSPKLQDKGNGHWVVTFKEDVTVDGQKAPIAICLTLIGHAAE